MESKKTMKTKEKDRDTMSFGMIANAGDGRSSAFLALQSAEQGDFEKAESLLEQAKKAAARAHQQQTQLLFDEVNGTPSAINLLLVHAQDHLMTSMLAIELIENMIHNLQRQREENASLQAQLDDLKKQLETR